MNECIKQRNTSVPVSELTKAWECNQIFVEKETAIFGALQMAMVKDYYKLVKFYR